MSKFPVDASIRKVVKSLQRLGFDIVREGNHIAMLREYSGYTSIQLSLFSVFFQVRQKDPFAFFPARPDKTLFFQKNPSWNYEIF